MSQLTRCPNCATTFRVSDAQLALRGGRVRCGHCSFVFNARACQVDADPVTIVDLGADPSFREHDPFWDPQPADAAATPEVDPVGAEVTGDMSAPEVAAEIEVESISWPQIPTEEEREHDASPASVADWVEQLEEMPPPAWLKAPSAVEPEPPAAPVTAPDEAFVPVKRLQEPPVDETLDDREAPHASDWLQPVGPSPWRWLWRAVNLLALLSAIALAALLLRQQVVQHYPAARPLLAAACARLGCEVQAPQNYELLFLDGIEFSFDPLDPQRLELNAVMRNTAAYAQRWPVIDVQLMDGKGRRVARRLLLPAQYLPPQEAGKPEFGPEQEVQLGIELNLNGITVENYTVGFWQGR